MNASDPIRCSEVIRELSTPTGQLDLDRFVDHLSACSACSAFADQARHLDHLWASTRPIPPTAGFETVWAGLQHEAATLSASGTRPIPLALATLPSPRPSAWRRGAIPAVVLALAAALLVLVSLPARDRSPADPPATSGLLADAHPGWEPGSTIDIEPSQLLIIRLDRLDDPSARFDRRDMDDLEVSATETVGLDPDVLAYFESRDAS